MDIVDLRDWFAVSAMRSYITKYGTAMPFEEMAGLAYGLADAMLAKREPWVKEITEKRKAVSDLEPQ